MKRYSFDPKPYADQILAILQEVVANKEFSRRKLQVMLRKSPKDGNKIFSKDELVMGYYHLVEIGKLEEDKTILDRIKMKPMRTMSGVTPLTVLTRPFPCPGKCIFCPNDVRMPKSYMSDEPGAQRAERNHFDPYLQTYNRLMAFKNMGHEVAKIELIILGGTWSYYPEVYQIWFIKRCFEALNDFGADNAGDRDQRSGIHTENIYKGTEKLGPEYDDTGRRKTYNRIMIEKEREAARAAGDEESVTLKEDHTARVNHETATWEELLEQQLINEIAAVRCVGLVIETRPDHIDEAEVVRVRRLGATKTQIGYQSLQDEVLELNKRGHDVAATERAVTLVRAGGFKVHIHWMPNLYGSTPEKDKEDYLKIFEKGFVPDEIKIYPCSLIATAELMDYHKKGLWKPYTEEELLDVLTFTMANTPRWVRLTRVIRDIPSTDIVDGNKKTNFRQIAENHIQKTGQKVTDIRAREIRGRSVTLDDLEFKITEYTGQTPSGDSHELFLEYVTKDDDKICGFLRLSLPKQNEVPHFIPELDGAAIIREIHVYGASQSLGAKGSKNTSQHLGLGKKLTEKAKEIATEAGYKNLAVISAIGTKEYYRKRGFEDGELYQHFGLVD